MAERTRFVQEFPSLSGPYQTEPVPSNIMEPYLDAAWLSGCSTLGGDVDHAALFQRVLYLRIHRSSPLVMASATEVIQDITL
jgi:hypothetical protein